MTLTLAAPAKLNLFLHILGRRPDGYHRLQTLFQLLDWGDTLQFTPNDSGAITLDFDGENIATQQNLIFRAASALQSGSRGVHIRAEKRIPAGGGLGGGSSDAATTLLALNHLWGLELPGARLQAIGAELGADVPVFVAGHSAWAEGTGEELTPVELPERWYLVVDPGCPVSTVEIFSHSELTRDTAPIKIAAFFKGDSRNDCQAVVRRLYPAVDNALKWLENFGDARLTGTGGCIFTDFDDKAAAERTCRQLPAPWQGFVARGLNTSPVITALN
jgi:4-diphosphocytidyl-2-C-methyl-D-erythritol kinase